MKLFEARKWSVVDIGCLKWSCIFFGMIVGALLAEFTLRYVWVFILLAFVLAIRPMIAYFRNDNR